MGRFIRRIFKVEEVNYFAVYTQDKWGVINNKGEIVVEPSYEEMILIPDHTKPVFLCTYNVDYNTQIYKTKAINENGEEILSGYDSIEAISNQNSKGQIWCEKDVFKVSKNGKVTAKKKGSAKITVKSGKKTVTCKVKVY